MDVYSEFKNHFSRNNYKKHQVVQSEAMIGMKCENIPIIEEVEGYSRKGSLYLVDPYNNIMDF